MIFKTDKQLKLDAQKISKRMGIPLSAYLNEQLKTLVATGHAEFRAPLVPNKKTARFLRQALMDSKKGKNMVGPFTSRTEEDAWLRSL